MRGILLHNPLLTTRIRRDPNRRRRPIMLHRDIPLDMNATLGRQSARARARPPAFHPRVARVFSIVLRVIEFERVGVCVHVVASQLDRVGRVATGRHAAVACAADGLDWVVGSRGGRGGEVFGEDHDEQGAQAGQAAAHDADVGLDGEHDEHVSSGICSTCQWHEM